MKKGRWLRRLRQSEEYLIRGANFISVAEVAACFAEHGRIALRSCRSLPDGSSDPENGDMKFAAVRSVILIIHIRGQAIFHYAYPPPEGQTDVLNSRAYLFHGWQASTMLCLCRSGPML